MQVRDSIKGVAGHRILYLCPGEAIDSSEIVAVLADRGYAPNMAAEWVSRVYDCLEEIAIVRNHPEIFAATA